MTEGLKSLIESNGNSPLWASNKKIIQIKIEVSPDVKNDYNSSQRSIKSQKGQKHRKRNTETGLSAPPSKNFDLKLNNVNTKSQEKGKEVSSQTSSQKNKNFQNKYLEDEKSPVEAQLGQIW